MHRKTNFLVLTKELKKSKNGFQSLKKRNGEQSIET
jgi:hypothetical protein